MSILAEIRRAKRASGARWVRNFGNLSLREILVMTSAYARPRLQTLGEGEWNPKESRPGMGGGEWAVMHLYGTSLLIPTYVR